MHRNRQSMKHIYITLAALLFPLLAVAQYQVQNSSFEDWEEISANGKTGKEPIGWNSYLSATGSHVPLVNNSYALLEQSTEVRPGSTGQYSAKIRARNLLAKNLYGNLTTGGVFANGMNPADAKQYYNYTDPANGQAMSFSGRPDSLKVWVKLNAGEGKDGLVSAILHTYGTYKTPIDTADVFVSTARPVAQAVQTVVANGKWTCYSIPFGYTPGVSGQPSFALVSMQTSNVPGQGDNGAVMLVDDMEFVYSSTLASIRYAGKNILGQTEVMEEFDESFLNITANGASATVETSYDETTFVLTVTVKGGDIAVNPENYHVYTYQFQKPEEEEPEPQPEPEFQFPAAGTEIEYDDELQVTVNATVNEPQEYTVNLTHHGNGVISFDLNNFVLESFGDYIPIGNIHLDDIQLVYNKDKKYSEFSVTQNIYIAAGDDPSYDVWMGPMLNSMYGAIPVTMTGYVDSQNLYVNIGINMMSTSLGQMIAVRFGNEFEGTDVPSENGTTPGPTYEPLPKSGTKVYTDNLVVQVNETVTPPIPADITVAFHKKSIDFALYNFVLELDGEKMYVGNIVIENLMVKHQGDGIYTYSFHDMLTIGAGDPTISSDWMGPILGALNLGMDGKISVNQVYVTIDIPLEALGQTIHVTFGKDEFDTAIRQVQSNEGTELCTGAFDLSGRPVTKTLRGQIYIEKGKKIVKQ